ncbi:aromatic ring-hydroxylating dioxygenase subunit alpha [Rhodobacteraceae bacterium NNCM2]|nr:aromatic ring-hydroxylating dioxygenase subunit alpha [Coraliihabitans acroporae]
MNATLQQDMPVEALPARYYTDPEIFAAARERIFARSWQYVCHQSAVPETGDYYAFTLMDQDLFIVRGRDEEVRCFYNVCQHRGHTLVADRGRTRVLVCPYHAWSYELEGPLRAAPGTRAMPGFDKSKICLTEVRLDSFLGFLFVNFDDEARPMRDCYPGVEEAVKALCPDIEEKIFADEHDAEEFCNWLVAVENYNECYHCGHVHKAFADGVIDPASYDIQPFGAGRVLHHASRAAAGEGAWYDTSGSDYGSFYLYPCFSLQIYPGGVVNTYYWRPLSHNDTQVHRGWFSRDGVVDDVLQSVIDLDRDTTFAEDLLLVKAVQRGLGSKGYRPGPLVISTGCGINSEHSIAALHNWVREDLG